MAAPCSHAWMVAAGMAAAITQRQHSSGWRESSCDSVLLQCEVGLELCWGFQPPAPGDSQESDPSIGGKQKPQCSHVRGAVVYGSLTQWLCCIYINGVLHQVPVQAAAAVVVHAVV